MSVKQSGFEIKNSLVCPVCGGHDFRNWREAFDDRYGHPGLFQLVRCQDCSHVMTTPMPGEEELSQLYGSYYPRENLSVYDIASQAEKIRLPFNYIWRWCAGTDNQGQYSVHAGEKMLDVGCGSGLSLLEAKELGAEAWGIDADPNVKRIASSLGINVHQGSLYDKPYGSIAFDLIVLNQVIEHIPEPDKALELIRPMLSPVGRVILVFPNVNSLWCKLSGNKWINWHIPYHLHHFNAETFAKMAKRCGYNIIHTRTITPNVWTLLQLRAIRQKITRGKPNPIWSVPVLDSANIKRSGMHISAIGRKLLKVPAIIIISVTNRIIDSLGLGDSLLVEIRPEEN